MATYKETVAAAAAIDADRIRAARESLTAAAIAEPGTMDGRAVLDAALARAWAGKLTALTDKDSSPKLSHDGGHVHIMPGIVYMAPARTRALNVDVCVAGQGCKLYGMCYHFDRHGAARRYAGVAIARVQRVALWAYAPNVWAAVLARDIDRLISRADRAGAVPAVRLNGLSDIDYRRFRPALWDGANPYERWDGLQFWDYTRVLGRCDGGAIPANYHLTFSLDTGNDAQAVEALGRGFNVAVLLSGDYEPGDTWGGAPIIDGDAHDYRFLDPSPGIVALKPKGPLRFGGRQLTDNRAVLEDAAAHRMLTPTEYDTVPANRAAAMARWVRHVGGGFETDRVPEYPNRARGLFGDSNRTGAVHLGRIAGRVREPMAPR
jgi:hypothetical protein